jgi:hypothetical protein
MAAPVTRFAIAILVGALSLPVPALASERFGVAASDGAGSCASVAAIGAALPVAVDVVVMAAPQRTLAGVLTAVLPRPCTALDSHDLAGPFFALRMRPEDALQPGEWAVLRVRPARAAAAERPVEFRACASSEGLHLTAWRGNARSRRRLWHEYVYLGQDLEPDCPPRDME